MTRNWWMSRGTGTEWWRPDAATLPQIQASGTAVASISAPASPVPFWAVMGFTFILLFAPQSYAPALAPFRIALVTAVIGIVAYLYDQFVHGHPLMMRVREMWITACLVGWAVITIPFSFWPGGSLSFLLDSYFKTLAIFWLLSHTVVTVGRLRYVAWGLSLMGVGLAVIAVGNFLSGAFIPGTKFVPRVLGNKASLTQNPNDLALMINLILPLSVALFLIYRKPLTRALLLGAILLDAVTVLITYSRGGFLTLATIVTVYLWKLRNQPERSWAWAAIFVALLCVPFLPSSYFDRLGSITDINADRTGSAQERWTDTVTSINYVLAHPIIGAGVGMTTLALNEAHGAVWRVVHNVYLEYAVDLGVPGLILFLLLFIGCLKSAAFVQRRSASVPALRDLYFLAEGIQVSLVAFAVAGQFHPAGYHFYFYYIAGLAVAAKALYQTATRQLAYDPR